MGSNGLRGKRTDSRCAGITPIILGGIEAADVSSPVFLFTAIQDACCDSKPMISVVTYADKGPPHVLVPDGKTGPQILQIAWLGSNFLRCRTSAFGWLGLVFVLH